MSDDEYPNPASQCSSPVLSDNGLDRGGPADEEAGIIENIYGTRDYHVAGDEETYVESFRIDHTRGDHQMAADAFLRRSTAPDLSSTQALGWLQQKHTFDFGSPAAGSRECKADDALVPTFYLDMIAIVGRPMKPIVHSSPRIFDNVTISLQHWAAPYRAKHIQGGIGFDLRHRTFRIASSSSRESWFIVMHPRLAISDID